MSKSKSIIFSITGIIIVSLFLIVYTFGYVLVKIKGNENSILSSLISKKVSVAYKEISNTSNGETISPGYEFVKVFTATNDGNVEVNYHIYLDNVENEFVNVQDITYTLYRSKLNGTIDANNLSDSDIVATGTFPTTDAYIKFNEEIEKPNDYYTYALKINYADTTENQNEDDNLEFTFRVQLDLYYPFEEGTLAYNILNNAINVTDEEKSNGYAEYMTFPLTIPAQEINEETESVLSVTSDDYGTSYYYRGNVKNNYINFAGMCWRIVRIAGDVSVKMTLAAQKDCSEITSSDTGTAFIGTGNYGYDSTSTNTEGKIYKMNYLNPVTDNTSSMVKAFYDFQTTNLKDYTDKLKAGDWCLGDTAYSRTGSSKSNYTYTLLIDTSSNYSSGTSFYYDAYARLTGNNKDGYNPSLKCNGTKLDKFATVTNVSEETSMYVSALTADEVAYAGGSWTGSNTNFYLNNNASSNSWRLLSSSHFFERFDCTLGVLYNGRFETMLYVSTANRSFRPSIVLKSNTTISKGNGTQSNPYIVN